MTRTRNRWLTAVLAAVLTVFCFGGMAAFADTDPAKDAVPDLPGGPYSLTVNMVSTNPDTSQTGIPGAKLAVYQVATLWVDRTGAEYEITPDFASTGITFPDMTASESNEYAKEFYGIVNAGGLAPDETQTTDGSGMARFPDLDPGIYMVTLANYGADSHYTEMEPFLVLVPGIDKKDSGNEWITSVEVTPKLAINPVDYIEVDPPVKKSVEGSPSEADEFVFELSAKDITNPMPAGSADGKKQVTIMGAGEVEFGVWRYTEPGEYSYMIREVPGSNSSYKYDNTIYYYTDKVTYEGSKLKLVTTITDSNGKTYGDAAEFEFVNKYNKTLVPKTGDDTSVFGWIVCAAAAIVLAVLARKRQKENKE